MNDWIIRSFNLYDSIGYLDKLFAIYPIKNNDIRKIDKSLEETLKKAYDNKNDLELFKLLLLINKFPLKDSYKPYFSRVPNKELTTVLKNNPKTVSRLCDRIYAMGFEKMIEGIEEPIETNRQMGPLFPNWLRSNYPSYENFDSFLASNNKISVLHGSDSALVLFVKNILSVSLPTGSNNAEKGLDMVVKVNTKPNATFVIGEAKFLTDEGGHQNAQLKDALHLVNSTNFSNNGTFHVIRVAILDGVCWIKSKNTKMQQDIKGLANDKIAISALLLDDFFNSLL